MLNLPAAGQLHHASFVLLCLVCTTLAATESDVAPVSEPITKAPKAVEAKQGLPLVPTRRIAFTTDEGTWLSVDASPTDATLVVEVFGDLYALATTGGKAQRLTSGLAYDSQPSFSPDGQSIVFVSDRSGQDNLWLMDSNGENLRQLSHNKGNNEFVSPSFAPDGQHVVVSRGGWSLRTFELWAYHLRGGKGVRLTRSKANANTPAEQRANYLGAVYSKDGRYLYYSRKSGGFAYNLKMPQWQVARFDVRDGTEVNLTASLGSAFRPELSPNGEFLVYGTRIDQQTSLRVRNLVTGADRLLIDGVEHDEQESRFTRDLLPGYSFSPDGKSLFVSRGGKLAKVALADGSATLVPMEVSVEQDLGPKLNFPYRLAQGPVKARLLQRPVLSPDGERVAFSAFARIYLHNFANKKTTAITPESLQAFHPSWSPDGRSLTFVSWTAQGGQVWTTKISSRGGSRPKQITKIAAAYYQPSYSPDGKRIVALRGSGYERLYRESDFGVPVGSDLVWLPSSGGSATLVTPVQGATRPHFGPEDDRIYYYENSQSIPSGQSGRLVSVRFDGSDRRVVFSTQGVGNYRAEKAVSASDVVVSADGRHILASHANQLYLFARLNNWLGGVQQKLGAASLPMVKITDVGADHFGFSADGQRAYWSVGHSFYSRALDSVAFESDKAADEDQTQKPSKDEFEAKKAGTKAPNFDRLDVAENDPGVTSHLIELYRPRAKPEGLLALVGGTAITMADEAAPQQVIENAVILVENDRLLAVGSAADVEIPSSAKVLDVTGKFLLPGYVDTHAHFRPLRELMDTSNWGFMANLAYGVTTGLDVQPSTVDIIAYEDMIDAGMVLGPRALSTGPGVFSNNNFKSAEHAYQVLRRYKEHYGVHNLKAYISGNRQQRQWLVQAAAELRLMPTTEGSLDMRLDMTHVLDGFTGNEHNFPVLDLYEDSVKMVAQSGIGYTPTLLVLYGGPWAENYFYSREAPANNSKLLRFTPQQVVDIRANRRSLWVRDEEQRFPLAAASAAKIVDAGGRVGVGSHGQLQGLGYHWELWALASGGMPNANALRAATLHGAQIIGVAQDIGSLEPGKLADIVVLNSNPLDELRSSADLHLVIKGGMTYEADSLNSVWPQAQQLPQQWWQPSPTP